MHLRPVPALPAWQENPARMPLKFHSAHARFRCKLVASMPARFARSIILCALGLLRAASMCGQTPSAAPSLASFASEPYVVTSSSTVIAMNADGTRTQTLAVAAPASSTATPASTSSSSRPLTAFR